MKKGTEITGKIEYTDFPNKGSLFVDGEKVIVKGTIAGQTVRGVINKGRKGRYEARLLEVTERSYIETNEPMCPHFGICGGCFYQTLSYENQLNIKAGHVKKLLDAVIKEDYVFEKPVGSPIDREYRNKMEFTFGNEYKDGPVCLGLHRKGSFYDIVPVHECKLVNEDIREILVATEEFAKHSGFTFYHKMTKEGYFRHLLVRRSFMGGILIDIITTSGPGPDLNEFKKKMLGLKCASRIKGILNTVNNSIADVVRDEGTTILYGEDFITEKLLGLDFKISPFSFFQTNSKGAEVLYEKVREFAGHEGDGAVIYDLYSGTGTIGQMMAPVAKSVVGIEIIEEAVEAAKENALQNGLSNCTFIAGDVLKMLDEVEVKPDFIILDPPREGIHPKALPKILSYGVEKMIYISCKPTSLANDLVTIQEAGYRVDRVCCVDMFCYSTHVETVILLSQRKADDYV